MDNLLDLFKIYLDSQGLSVVSKINYCADLRHFLEWLILRLRTTRVAFSEDHPPSLASMITRERIELYKSFLLKNKTKLKTVNRRLSSLRKLCSFAVSQGWLDTNPGKQIENSRSDKWDNVEVNLLKDFEKYLKSDSASNITIQNYTVDINQFLNFLRGV